MGVVSARPKVDLTTQTLVQFCVTLKITDGQLSWDEPDWCQVNLRRCLRLDSFYEGSDSLTEGPPDQDQEPVQLDQMLVSDWDGEDEFTELIFALPWDGPQAGGA
jgi:hypothetical protein